MHICLIGRFFSSISGGLGVYSKVLYENLPKYGLQASKVQSFEESLNMYKFVLWYNLKLVHDVKKTHANIYHATSPWEATWLYKLHKNAIKIATVHDIIPLLFNLSKNVIKERISKFLYKLALRNIKKLDFVIVNSEETKNYLVDYFGYKEELIEIIHPGVDLDKYHPIKVNGGNSILKVGVLGRMDAHKRHYLVIKAIKKIKSRKIRALIGGVGKMFDYCYALARGDRRIKFLGFVPDSKMNEFYNSLDLFILPSKIEGFGIPILEAFACGKPVIVMKDANIPKVLKEKCIVVSPRKLRKVLEYYIENKEDLRKYSEDLVNFARKFSWEEAVKKHIVVYEEIYNARQVENY